MEGLISTILLPALCLVPMNVSLVEDVWQMLQTFPFYTRYSFYGNLKVRGQQTAWRRAKPSSAHAEGQSSVQLANAAGIFDSISGANIGTWTSLVFRNFTNS